MKKTIALILCLAACLCLFAGCGKPASDATIALPAVEVEDSLENRQKAIVEVAKAYYYKNPYMQYDNQSMSLAGHIGGTRGRLNQYNAPEYASEDLLVYSVCSAYVYDCIWQSMQHELTGTRATCVTDIISSCKNIPEEIVLVQHDVIASDTEGTEAVIAEIKELLQPGDVVTYYRRNSSGHTVIYCGDLDGDGKGDLLHCDGKTYDFETGQDTVEENGSIYLNTKKMPSSDAFLFDEASSEYLGKMKKFSLIRPALLNTEEHPLSESVKTRMLFPDMAIYYTADCGVYGAVTKGEELTYTLTVENHGETAYEGLLVQIQIPENATLTAIDDEEAKGGLVKWTLDVPAGETVTHTYTVKATGEVGSQIAAMTGYVHTIPLNEIVTGIQSAAVTTDDVRTAAANAADKAGADFVNAVTAELLGSDPQIPALPELLEGIFSAVRMDKENVGRFYIYTLQDLDELTNPEFAKYRKMVIHQYIGGRNLQAGITSDRVQTTRYQDLKPGDVLIWDTDLKQDGYEVAVFDGEFLIYPDGGQAKSMLESRFEKMLSYNIFVALRPAQGM